MTRALIGLGLGLALVAGGIEARAAEHQYVGVKKCRSCHKKELIGDQVGKWKEAKHAKAFETLKGEKAVEIAKEKGISGPPHKAGECLKCHVTAFGAEKKLIKYSLKAMDGVQCESCHGPGADYRKKKIMSDHDKAVAKGMWEVREDEKVCTACHNDESPTWEESELKLADGSFDFDKAKEEIEHPIPEDVKGRYLELEKKRRAERKARGLKDADGEDEEDEEDEEEDED